MLWVFVSLLIVQMALSIPDISSYKTDLYKRALQIEQTNLSTDLLNLSDVRGISGLPISENLLGASITDTNTNLHYQIGREILKSNDDTVWLLDTPYGALQIHAQISTSSADTILYGFVVKKLLSVLLISLVTALTSLILSYAYFTDPIVKLTKTLQKSRLEEATVDPSEATALQIPAEFFGLVDEYNLMVNEEREAIRQVKVKQKYLEYTAHHDPLTHLPNRLLFETKLKENVSESMKNGSSIAMFLINIDNFKFFNDQYGHNVGDEMLQELAIRISTAMRASDTVARLDGDEFAILQGGEINEENSTQEVAQRLLKLLSESFEYRGFSLKTNVSIGISIFPDDVHLDKGSNSAIEEELFSNAAFALQEAKANGRARAQAFTETMRNNIIERLTLEEDIKSALLEGQFEVFYQPKINMQNGSIVGSEALVRWNHPTLGSVRPDVFIPVAEESGSIIALGEWILRTACEQTQQLHVMGYADIQVAVNISTVQFTAGKLLSTVEHILNDTGFSATSLELEITESAVIHDIEDVIRTLHSLSNHGVRLAIDDFGTGYSSLSYLKRFPVDTLKIDQAFIKDISNDNDDAEIVGAILSLGKYFGLKVVAEGVEEEEQLNFLRDQGCDIAQGYFVSKPLPFGAFTNWLQEKQAKADFTLPITGIRG